jgi:hypothetical protein
VNCEVHGTPRTISVHAIWARNMMIIEFGADVLERHVFKLSVEITFLPAAVNSRGRKKIS